MENQHRLIKGYRDLSAEEIGLMNEIKAQAEEVGVLVAKVSQLREADKRWAAIGQTDLQKGFMALTRAVARPVTF